MQVKNFRNIGDVTLDFTESPIVTLVGENEAGKTSIVKAFKVCALNDSPRDQKGYIRDNTSAFGVQIALEDGNCILRYKEHNGRNLYRVIDKDGKVWEQSKVTDGVPDKVQELMGLTTETETGEYLNVRTYEDRLLFVVTPASTNYKVMYNALKVEQLTKAIKLGSDELNGIKSVVNKNENSINTLGDQLKTIVVRDLSPLRAIRDRIAQQMNSLEHAERIEKLVEKLNSIDEQLGAYELINVYNLQPIDEITAVKLNSVSRLLDRLSNANENLEMYSEIETLEEIDLSKLNMVNSIINKQAELDEKLRVAGSLALVADLEPISEVTVGHVNKITTMLNRLDTIDGQIKVYDTTGVDEIDLREINAISRLEKIKASLERVEQNSIYIEQCDNYVTQVQDYLKQLGVAVETCPKCGEAVIFDIDKMGV